MHVLSLTTIYPDEQNPTQGRSVAFLDRALAKLGIPGTTLVLKPWVPFWLAVRLPQWRHLAMSQQVMERGGMQTVFSHYPHIPHRYHQAFDVCSMARQAIRLIRKHRLKFDLVHGQSIYPAAPAARLVARRFGVPFVVTLRDDLSHLSYWYEHRKGRKLFEPMFASVSAVFVHGPSLLRDLPRFIPPGAHPDVLMAPNGVDHEGIESILESLRSSPPRPWGSIVSVSSLYRLKGIHEHLRALRLLDERGFGRWRYTIVGDGPYRMELQDLSKELGLASKVTFVGSVPYPEAIRYIRDNDIFCLASWAESFGNVYAEAAMCGRPSIGCKGFGGEVTIRNGETGLLVPPKDAEGLADALLFLLSQPERARRMGQAARDHIRPFTWERTAGQYKEILNRVTARVGSSRDQEDSLKDVGLAANDIAVTAE
jgi:teichuronic acid biosynthesis glycosyltransferase TuaC